MTARAKENLILLMITLFILMVGAFCLANKLGQTPLGFFSYLIENGFQPHINIMKPLIVGGSPLYIYFYYSVLFGFILASALKFIPSIPLFKGRSLRSLLITLGFLTFFCSVGLQFVITLNWIVPQYRALKGLSLTERHLAIEYGDVYQFARYTRWQLKEYKSARLITDMNITKDPEMYIRNFLAYHLYPLDLRDIRGEPVDSLIIYRKKNALQFVPEDFEVLKELNDNTVIAVRKGAHHAAD